MRKNCQGKNSVNALCVRTGRSHHRVCNTFHFDKDSKGWYFYRVSKEYAEKLSGEKLSVNALCVRTGRSHHRVCNTFHFDKDSKGWYFYRVSKEYAEKLSGEKLSVNALCVRTGRSHHRVCNTFHFDKDSKGWYFCRMSKEYEEKLSVNALCVRTGRSHHHVCDTFHLDKDSKGWYFCRMSKEYEEKLLVNALCVRTGRSHHRPQSISTDKVQQETRPMDRPHTNNLPTSRPSPRNNHQHSSEPLSQPPPFARSRSEGSAAGNGHVNSVVQGGVGAPTPLLPEDSLPLHLSVSSASTGKPDASPMPLQQWVGMFSSTQYMCW